MVLSPLVQRTTHQGRLGLFHTITKVFLDLDASEAELESSLFLAGQEQEAIFQTLNTPPVRLLLTLVPTWYCNLRCSHCSVLHLLQPKKEGRINAEQLGRFVESYCDRYSQTLRRIDVTYVGGEALTDIDQCLELADAVRDGIRNFKGEIGQNTTTNLAYPLNRRHIEMFERLETIVVSIDGNKEQHNTQRHGYETRGLDCYETTVSNLRKLMALGFRDKVKVQAAVRDEYLTMDYIKQFYVAMMRKGVRYENIKYAGLHPTVWKPQMSQSFINNRVTPRLRQLPCCKYRLMGNIQVNPDNTLMDNFYIQEGSSLGLLSDSVEEVEKKHRAMILGSMPVLQDETCMKCPVIGYCWGMCVNGYSAVSRPSELCAQKALIEHVGELASSGELLSVHDAPRG